MRFCASAGASWLYAACVETGQDLPTLLGIEDPVIAWQMRVGMYEARHTAPPKSDEDRVADIAREGEANIAAAKKKLGVR